MIPIRLQLRNFMTYRESRLELQGVHLAVLTGENGAGKSSLLDAITWALWGKARARRDDELIHLGQTEMEVEYTFGLNGNQYRIVRKRDATGRGRSDLSFQVAEAGGWRTLTETSIRATQYKINNQIRLDYDTFINSAFLLQGRADEFTTKRPAERKQILSDILGLQIYEEYEKRTKRRAKEKENEANRLTAQIEQIEQELAREVQYRQELAEAEQAARTAEQQLQLAETELERLREKYQALDYKRNQMDDLQGRLQNAEADLAELTQTIAAVETDIDRYRAILQRREEIEAGLARLQQARHRVQDWEERLQQSVQLSERKHTLDRAFNEARAKIEADLRETQTRLDILQPQAGQLEEKQGDLAETETELTRLQQLSAERETNQQTLTELKEEAADLKAQNRQLKIEMEVIRDRLTQLTEAGSDCPVCRQPLDETHRQKVLAQFEQEGKTKGNSYRANQTRLEEIAEAQKELLRQVNEADLELRSLAAIQGRVATLQQAVEEAEKAGQEMARTQSQHNALQQQLAEESFAADIVAQLAEARAELAALGYESEAHRQAKAEVQSLLHFEEESRQLAEAEQRLAELQERLAREQERHDRLETQTTADRQKITALEEETAALPELRRELHQADLKVTAVQREYRLARDKVAAANQKLNHVAAQAKRRADLEEHRQQVRQSLGLYRELQVAFGKKGVQAMLIENAIPEIEDEANKLLSRMTDSRMNVRFETQRETKSGDGAIETLDILIADELGTRDYELYSGGEAFRVNFAIRVAISKVLARRAGAQLQTLVIDEGFGTQDAQGRERLIEAINAIQQDFEKVIVITHIDELKDVFPVRIDVWKTPEGSQIAIR